MGGSILGTEAIYQFLKKKIKKEFIFINNLNSKILPQKFQLSEKFRGQMKSKFQSNYRKTRSRR